MIADFEVWVSRSDHFADRAADHDLVEVLGGGIGFRLIHAPAHVGIEREIMVLDEHLSFAGLADLLLDETEVRSICFALRARGEYDSLVAWHVRLPIL